MLNVMTVEWDPYDSLPSIEDIRNHIIQIDIEQHNNSNSNSNNWSNTAPAGTTTTLISLSYQGQMFEISDVSCNQFWNYAQLNEGNWREILTYRFGENNYPHEWSYWIYESFNDLENENYNDENSIQRQCRLPSVETTLFSITIEEGQALRFVQLPHLYSLIMTCDDGFSAAVHDDFVGGQAECTVTGIATSQMRGYSMSYERLWNWNTSSYYWPENMPSEILNEIPAPYRDPSWDTRYENLNYWSVMTDMQPPWNHDGDTWADYPPQTSTPLSFYVYFEMHFVQVHESE